MKRPTYIIILIIFLVSCATTDKGHYYDFEYDYEIKSYYSNSDDPENFRYSEFYRNDTLIRQIDREGSCLRFFYNSTGQIAETRWGRNCSYGRRNLFIYDSLNNHIGYFSTMDSIINLDTVKYDQILFYDNQNRLIKKRTDKRKNMDGVDFETWKHFVYLNNKIDREIILTNGDTIWNGKYYYNTNENLIKIHRERKKVYETEFFKYNSAGLLIEKEIISTANPITPETSFSAGNNKRTYEYDSNGFLTIERVLNHKGKVQIKTIYLRNENKITPP